MSVSTATRTYNSPRLIERQENIMAAAREELAEKGYDAVTMDGLAKRAGVSRRTLYNNYGNKDDLVITAISEIISSYHQVDAGIEAGIPSLVASREAAVHQVLSAPAYADAMTAALFQAGPEHRLVQLLITDGIRFTLDHLTVEKELGGIREDILLEDLADEIMSQAWGQVLLNQKRVTPLSSFARKSLVGLLLLLEAASVGSRRDWISKQIRNISSA